MHDIITEHAKDTQLLRAHIHMILYAEAYEPVSGIAGTLRSI